MELQGAKVLVTGGAQRLGRAIATELARRGAHVMIHYHSSADEAQAVVEELAALAGEAGSVQGDLAVVAEAERVADAALKRWGGLDLLVNNSGIWGKTPLGSVTAERWDELIATNVRGAFFVSQRAAPALRASPGAIVNIADVGALRPWRNYTPYLVSKGAVVTLTEALAKDLAPDVRVNAVAPGPVLLPESSSEEDEKKAARSTLLGRVGSAEDIARAVAFLASADYITGVILPVDGGQRLI
ncbi:short-chain dehydrogenase [Kouleothrix aurantiaca]|uniref:Short-chain dehydrogenase n=1 Tax=Kouleothrix aurantiaca TaxID=186479 RepID=A0A0P9F120_9CHLR|nr:short-chain dehydrogenase [Kouleothrix aurantiaca]